MKLYDVPPGSRVRVIGDLNDELKFHHIDGMYSLCTNQKGEPVHLVAWAEVELICDV
jgi:hypothetical protein